MERRNEGKEKHKKAEANYIDNYSSNTFCSRNNRIYFHHVEDDQRRRTS